MDQAWIYKLSWGNQARKKGNFIPNFLGMLRGWTSWTSLGNNMKTQKNENWAFIRQLQL